jgi:hypothetical protein
MWYVVLQLVVKVLANIFSSELELGRGRGPEKRELVLGNARPELEELLTRNQIGGCDPQELLEHVGAIVDGAVGLFNCFGVFSSSVYHPPASSPAPASSDPSSSS